VVFGRGIAATARNLVQHRQPLIPAGTSMTGGSRSCSRTEDRGRCGPDTCAALYVGATCLVRGRPG